VTVLTLLPAVDRLAGRLYTRVLALLTGAIAAVLLIAGAVLLGRSGGHPFGLVWTAGGVLFALIARGLWRSRAPLSDLDAG
jgi:hypothetical protein